MGSTATDIIAVGRLATRLHVSVQTVERLSSDLGIKPSIRINSVPFLDEKDAQRLAAHLANKQ